MFLHPFHDDRQTGSITVFFVLFVLVASAAISYAVYVGRTTEEKMRTDIAADLSSLAMAQHAAMGLNMLATNNLAIGGNLHIGAAVPFLGRYYAVIKAMDFDSETSDDWSEYKDLMAGDTTADESDYGKGFDKTKALAGRFIKNAAGLTTINRTLATHWLKGGLVKGVEQLRLNKPGAVGLMFQASTAGSASSAVQFYNMKFNNLALSSPKMTMCQSIQASQGLADRNLSSFWLGGVVKSLGAGAAVGGAIDVVQTIEGLLQGVNSTVGEQVADTSKKMEDEVRSYTGGLSCGDDFSELERYRREEAESRCAKIKKLKSASQPGSLFPQFQDCGLTQSGNFGEQFEHFGNDEKIGNEIGFIFADVQGSNLKSYEDSLQFAAAVGNPLYLFGEMPTRNNQGVQATACPAAWKVEVNGHQYCSLMLDGLDFGTASNSAEPEDRDLSSGGVGRAVGANGGQGKGSLNGIWSRVQWSIGQAKAEYEPGDGDPDAASFQTSGEHTDANLRANKRRMQFFWPAWKARAAEPSVLANVLKLLGTY